MRRMGASRACRWPGKRKGDRANAEIASAMVGASRGCERSPGGWGQPARRAEPAVRSAVGRKTRRCSPTVLNAEILLPAFKGARQSDRDFVTHVWTKVPMPRFEPANPLAQETGVAWRARGARRDAGVRSGQHPCQGQSRGKEGDRRRDVWPDRRHMRQAHAAARAAGDSGRSQRRQSVPEPTAATPQLGAASSISPSSVTSSSPYFFATVTYAES